MLNLFKHKEFEKWYEKLFDNRTKKLILARIRQVQVHEGFVGDCKPVGSGITEMRIHFGPGYRIYAAIRQKEFLLLLIGGSKSSQKADIDKAKAHLAEWIKAYETEKRKAENDKAEDSR